MEANLYSCSAISFPRKDEITDRMQAIETEGRALGIGGTIDLLIIVDTSNEGPKLNISLPTLKEIRAKSCRMETDIQLFVRHIDELLALAQRAQDEINRRMT